MKKNRRWVLAAALAVLLAFSHGAAQAAAPASQTSDLCSLLSEVGVTDLKQLEDPKFPSSCIGTSSGVPFAIILRFPNATAARQSTLDSARNYPDQRPIADVGELGFESPSGVDPDAFLNIMGWTIGFSRDCYAFLGAVGGDENVSRPVEPLRSMVTQIDEKLKALPACAGGEPASVPAATSVAPETVILSDDFNRADADRCELGAGNTALGGDRKLYYLPIFPSGPNDPSPLGANLISGALQNNTLDYGGFQFALSAPCAAARGTIRGADMGQDLNIRADLLVPTNAVGDISQAGPYVRSRAAAVGDGIIGGASAGYWVQLESTGEVKVKRLNPPAVIAVSGIPVSFDPAMSHKLEIAAGGDQLQVALDGKLQTFKQDEQLVTVVDIPPTAGANDGTAGIAFGAEPNRGKIGGQRADNIVVAAYRPLDGLPIQNNFARPSAPTALPAPSAAISLPLPTSSASATAAPATPALIATAPSRPSAAPVASASAPNLSRADCDGDGALTEVDALCALDMSVQLKQVNLGMDVDGSGSVDSHDAAIILQHVVGK